MAEGGGNFLSAARGVIELNVAPAIAALGKLVEASKTAGEQSQAAFKQADDGARNFGAGMAVAGVAILGGVALIGKASIDAASQFQSSMELIRTQAGASQTEVDNMSKAILGLAPQVGTGPDELATALYHIESAGFRGQQALEAVKIAAEGARVGQANLEDVTNGLNAVLVAGVPEAKNMAGAMGELNAIVGAGDMHMQDLADALGTGILATAKNFGLGLADVGAALAVFGDNNIRGADAATRLRQTISLMAAPSGTAAKALAEVGISSTELASDMRSGGLIAAISDLQQHLQDSGKSAVEQGEIISKAFGGAKGATGVEILLQQLDRLKQKYGEVQAGAAKFGDAWQATQTTAAFQTERFHATIDALKVGIGTALLPAVTSLLLTITPLIVAMSKWTDEHPRLIAGIFAAVAALGAFLVITGLTIVALDTLLSPVALVIAAIAGLGAALAIAYRTDFLGFADGVNAVIGVMKSFAGYLRDVFESGNTLTGSLKNLPPALRQFAQGVGILVDTAHDFVAAYGEDGILGVLRQIPAEIFDTARAFATMLGAIPGFSGVSKALLSAISSVESRFNAFVADLQKVQNAFTALRSQGFGVIQSAVLALSAVFPALTKVFQDVGAEIDHLIQAGRDLYQAFQDFLNGDFQAGFTQLGAAVVQVFEAMIDHFKTVGDLILAAFNAIDWSAVGAAMLTGLRAAIALLAQLGGSLFDAIVAAVKQIDWSSVGKTLLTGLTSALSAIASVAVPLAKEIGTAVLNAVKAADWGSVGAALLAALEATVGALGDLASALFTWLSNSVKNIDWGHVWDAVQDATKAIVGKLGDIGKAIADWIGGAVKDIDWAGLWAGVSDVAGIIIAKLGDIKNALAQWLLTAVGDIDWGGLFAGVADVAGTIVSKLGDVKNAIEQWLITAVGHIDWAGLFSGVTDVAGLIVSKLGDIKNAIEQWLLTAVGDINWNGLFAGVSNVAGIIVSKLGDIKNAIEQWLLTAVGNIDWGGLFSGVVDVTGAIVKKLGNLGGALKGWLSDAAEALSQSNAAQTITSAVSPIVTVFGAISGTASAIAGAVRTAAKDLGGISWPKPPGLDDLEGVFSAVIGLVTSIASAVQTAAAALGKISFSNPPGLDILSGALSALIGLITSIGGAVKTAAYTIRGISIPKPPGLEDLKTLVDGVGKAVDGIGGAVQAAANALDKIHIPTPPGLDKLKGLLDDVTGALSKIPFIGSGGGGSAKAASAPQTSGLPLPPGQSQITLFTEASTAADNAKKTIVNDITDIINKLTGKGGLKDVFDNTSLKDDGTKLGTDFVNAAQKAFDGLNHVWGSVVNGSQNYINEIDTLLKGAGTQLATDFVNAAQKAFDGLNRVWESVLGGSQSHINTIDTLVKGAGTQTGNDFTDNLRSALNDVNGVLDSVQRGLDSHLQSAASTAWFDGSNIGSSLASGMQAAVPQVQAAAQALVDAANNTTRTGFVLGSPSRLYMQFASWIIDGFLQPFAQRAGEVAAVLKNTFAPQSLGTAMTVGLNLAAQLPVGNLGGQSVVQYNVTQYALKSDELVNLMQQAELGAGLATSLDSGSARMVAFGR